MLELNRIYNVDCVNGMKSLSDECIDLTITSPPYDNLRDYNGYSFDFENTAKELYRVSKPGATIVWIVNDATIEGSETGTSFKQALYFKKIGFNIHDTMIWEKPTFTATGALRTRYGQVFEYMFIFTKGKIKTFNPIKDRKNKRAGEPIHGTVRQKDGSFRSVSAIGKPVAEYGQRFNIWQISPEKSSKNRFHPAQFPISLINDRVISWSNENDLVLDPFMGSGTTALVCKSLNRSFIGFEISEEYCKIAEARLNEH